MPHQLCAYAHERIVRLWQLDKTPTFIVRELAQDGIYTTSWTVHHRIFAWTKGGGLEDRRRSGRPSSITEEIAAYMNMMLDDHDELTASEIHRLIARKFSARIPTSTIQRFLRLKLKWVVVRARTGPMISEKNKLKRLEFAKQCIAAEDSFDDVVWTDESSIQLVRHTKSIRVKVGKEKNFKPVPKHALKVHVWAGISKRGATNICIFDQIMDVVVYVDILKDCLVPFLKDRFPDGHRFMQDNDPKHTSRLAKAYIQEQDLNWWCTPASSADINPIERVWAELKHYIARRVKPLTKADLVKGILPFWSRRMTPGKCRKYIGHTHKVLPKVVAKNGGITGE